MKKLIFFFLCLIAFQKLKAQTIKVNKVTNIDLEYILNNINLLDKHISSKSDLYINLYEVTNPSGSAGFASCEVSSNLYIVVSEDGEAPEHHLFQIKNINFPKFIKWSNPPMDNEFFLSFSDKLGKKKTIKIKVDLSKVELKLLK